MDTAQTRQLMEKVHILNNMPLHKITRAASTLCLQFGNLVSARAIVRNAEGKLEMGKAQIGEYALHIQCCFRVLCDHDVIVARNDLFQPSDAYMRSHALTSEDAIPDDFDYDIIGNNRLDEIITTTLHDLDSFIVESVKMNVFGDLFIKFTNGFSIDAIIDISGSEECWRFFKHGDEEHLVITGQGLAMDEETSDSE